MWPLEQRNQLNELQTLLRKASSLNEGSGVIDKMLEIHRIANIIMFGERGSGEHSFYQFLEKEATKGHDAQKMGGDKMV